MTTTPTKQPGKRPADTALWLVVLLGILIEGACLRLVGGLSRPGWEWDEPVYTTVATNLLHGDGLSMKRQVFLPDSPYLSQPPFHFLAVRSWLEVTGLSGVEGARLLAVLCGLIVVAVTALTVRRIAGDIGGLLAAGLLALDSWLVFEHRIAWMDNLHLVLVAVMWLAWVRAVERAEQGRARIVDWVWVGLAAGTVVMFKHIGALYLVALVIAFVLQASSIRAGIKVSRAVLATFSAAIYSIATYAVTMYLIYGQYWLKDTLHQFDRVTGKSTSRGSLTTDALVSQLFDRYSVFTTTWLLVAAAGLLMVIRMVRVRRGTADWDGLQPLVAATLGAGLGLAGLGMKFPHYFMMAFVPLLAYLAAEVGLRWPTASTGKRVAVVLTGLLVAFGDISGGMARVFHYPDDALRQTVGYLDQRTVDTDLVLADESVGVPIRAPYCKLEEAERCLPAATWLVTYESITQKLPDIAALTQARAAAVQCAQFTGFKETITIYRIAGDCPRA